MSFAATCRDNGGDDWRRQPDDDGYAYMGLQFKNSCFCGDSYDKEDGTGRLDISECDINGDSVPDCGMNTATDGQVNPHACEWRNAVYELSPQQESCQAYDEGPCAATGRASSAGFRSQCLAAGDCLYTPADTTVGVDGGALGQGTCKPTSYDYCVGVGMRSRYVTTQCAMDARPDWDIQGGCQYNDPVSSTGWGAHDRTKCWENGNFDSDCRATRGSASCRDDFTMSFTTTCDGNRACDYYCMPPDTVISPASCSSVVPLENCNSLLAAACGTAADCTWTPPATQQESCVAADKAACDAVQAQMGSGAEVLCPGRVQGEYCDGTGDCGGAYCNCAAGVALCSSNTAVATGDGNRAVISNNLDGAEAMCAAAGACRFQAADTPRFIGCYQDSEGTGGSAIQLAGNTQANDDYGLTFDGDDDWAVITAEGAGNYARDGTFTIGFYFTRQDCYSPNEWQALFSHQGRGVYPRGGDLHVRVYRSSDTDIHDSIELYLGCSASGAEDMSIDGDFIRVVMADHSGADDASQGNKLAFDIPTAAEATGGYVTDTWAVRFLVDFPLLYDCFATDFGLFCN